MSIRPRHLLFGLAPTLSLAVALASTPPDDDPPAEPTPQSEFEEHSIRGWTVFVHESMREREPERLDQALELLSCCLYDVTRALPETAVEELHKVKIWFDPRDRHHACAVYHPSAGWLRRNDYDVAKTDSVHITNLRRFLQWTREQPSMVLHELAHAYHDQVLGFDQPEVIAAHQRAKRDGGYDEVLTASGHNRRHYALTDHKEFFAELTESVFGTNDFYPFVRAELGQHDPESRALVEKLWGVRGR